MNSPSFYTKQDKVVICGISKIEKKYDFPPNDYDQVQRVINEQNVPLESILKLIHYRYKNQGLRYTLIHKLFKCRQPQIEYYVPELVYIAVKKLCKPTRKFLVYKSAQSQSLRRLILWNLKAFTVLMKNRDQNIKSFVVSFQEDIVRTCKSKNKFNFAEKAISMLTTASLSLKAIQKEEQKAKLQGFIKRFNSEYLLNTEHTIMIPFRRSDASEEQTQVRITHQTKLFPQKMPKPKRKFNSNYLVRIIQQECSCFPTRKRVPYRIVLETIDAAELNQKKPQEGFKKPTAPKNQNQPDFFHQVAKKVQEGSSSLNLGSDLRKSHPFVIDIEEGAKIMQLAQYKMDIEKQEKQEKEKQKNKKMTGSKITKSLLRTLTKKSRQSAQSQIDKKRQENLKKFETIYIPTLPSPSRKSTSFINLQAVRQLDKQKKLYETRNSDRRDQKEKDIHIKTYIDKEEKLKEGVTGSVWGKSWDEKQAAYKAKSFYKQFDSLTLHNVVIKGGDDLRQQIICMQLIYKMRDILKQAGVPVIIKPYEIIVLSENSGLLEFVANSISIDALKKQYDNESTLNQFFQSIFIPETRKEKAKDNFAKSLAGSSILTYVLKLRDRHNGNILLDNEGNIIHIDFGFILGQSPGGLNFESSPFKLTEQYLEVMNWKEINPVQNYYSKFQDYFCNGMVVLRKKYEELCLILEIMMEESDLECFQKFEIETFKQRFRLDLSEQKFKQYCQALIDKSCMNSRTVHYDYFQYYTNGIEP